MRHQYYVDEIKRILEDRHYDDLMDLAIAPKIFGFYTINLATREGFNLAVRNHSLNLMNDAIQLAKGGTASIYDYRNFRSKPWDDELLEAKAFDILKKENALNLSLEIMDRIIPEFMHLVGADDFISDIDKRVILEQIEDILIEENNIYF